MVDESDFQRDGRSIEEKAAALHEDVEDRLAAGEISEDAAAEEHREISAIAARMLDSVPYHDPEDPPPDEV